MWVFHVFRKHLAVRHNKWSDGAISAALLTGREAQRERDTLIASSDPPLVFVYELIKHCPATAEASSPIAHTWLWMDTVGILQHLLYLNNSMLLSKLLPSLGNTSDFVSLVCMNIEREGMQS